MKPTPTFLAGLCMILVSGALFQWSSWPVFAAFVTGAAVLLMVVAALASLPSE